ncbi:MAG: glycoside hydrolase family 127 protein, partial [Draconibacterium sp.]|nr:glycoside hydrolase family 127 protein [Draconibacterium sp.]
EVVPANSKLLEQGVERWKGRFDMKEGGNTGAPKFPMPVNLEFLLYYGFMKKDNISLEYVKTTLEKMARGGIYDQIGGGFARYSVDGKWKVPHFEKMLYDNGQLLSIYSKGFQQYKNEEFKTVIYETVDFIERDLMDKSGAFYSSLDADSEGEEGRFYVWNKPELEEILKDDFELFSKYYNINKKGFWEHGNYILLRDESDKKFARENKLTAEQLHKNVLNWKSILLNKRANRVRPGLDDKTLTSWNALVIQGLTDAYKAFGDKRFLDLAKKNVTFLKENVMQSNGKLFHNWKNKTASVDGFMEDYSLLIQATISLFEVTGDKEWLDIANKLCDYTFSHFYDEKSGLFYFSKKNENSVVTNHFQKEDNVLPSSNSVMANNLHRLYLILGNTDYLTAAQKMVQHITPQFVQYPMAYANWGILMLKTTEPFIEVALTGKNAEHIFREILNGYQPNILWAFSKKSSDIPILKDRFIENKTLIYICENMACQIPVESVEEANKLLLTFN